MLLLFLLTSHTSNRSPDCVSITNITSVQAAALDADTMDPLGLGRVDTRTLQLVAAPKVVKSSGLQRFGSVAAQVRSLKRFGSSHSACCKLYQQGQGRHAHPAAGGCPQGRQVLGAAALRLRGRPGLQLEEALQQCLDVPQLHQQG